MQTFKSLLYTQKNGDQFSFRTPKKSLICNSIYIFLCKTKKIHLKTCWWTFLYIFNFLKFSIFPSYTSLLTFRVSSSRFSILFWHFFSSTFHLLHVTMWCRWCMRDVEIMRKYCLLSRVENSSWWKALNISHFLLSHLLINPEEKRQEKF